MYVDAVLVLVAKVETEIKSPTHTRQRARGIGEKKEQRRATVQHQAVHEKKTSFQQRYPASTTTQTQTTEQMALPGMKRGIAIGVAASVTIIIIALVAHVCYRRRRNLRIKALEAQLQSSQTMHTPHVPWPGEKYQVHGPEDASSYAGQEGYWTRHPSAAAAVEIDACTIHELDGMGNLPELPTKAHVQEMDGKGIDEERGVGTQTSRSMSTRVKSGLSDWARWTAGLDRKFGSNSERVPASSSSVSSKDKSVGRSESRDMDSSAPITRTNSRASTPRSMYVVTVFPPPTSRPNTAHTTASSRRQELGQLDVSPAEVSPLGSTGADTRVSEIRSDVSSPSSGLEGNGGSAWISPLEGSVLGETWGREDGEGRRE